LTRLLRRYDAGMSFLALLFALLIEQVRPLAERNPVHQAMRHWAHWVSRTLDAGRAHQAWTIWGLTVVTPTLVAAAVHWALMWWVGWPVAMVWSIGILYATLGFRQFSHHFTEIRDALDTGDENQVRERLAAWQQVDASLVPRRELLRHVIEFSALAAHRHVFGVLAWFSVLAALGLGPAGAVLYRMGEFVPRLWRRQAAVDTEPGLLNSEALSQVASQAWRRIDWVPARITALAFAVVGNFEEAIDCWRNHAQAFPDDNDGVVLAATSGAINVRLGGEALRPRSETLQPALGDSASTPGKEAEPGHLRTMVGLVWRTVVMWLVLLALLTLARLLG
jgi:adenosylcobinamide-phosphate synthase